MLCKVDPNFTWSPAGSMAAIQARQVQARQAPSPCICPSIRLPASLRLQFPLTSRTRRNPGQIVEVWIHGIDDDDDDDGNDGNDGNDDTTPEKVVLVPRLCHGPRFLPSTLLQLSLVPSLSRFVPE